MPDTIDTMANIALIVASILGTTGLAGIIAVGVQFSRRARLRKAIEHSQIALKLVGEKSPAGLELVHAMQIDGLRLAAISIIRVGVPSRSFFSIFVMAAVVGTICATLIRFAGIALPVPEILGGTLSREALRTVAASYITVYIALLFSCFMSADMILNRRRERFVVTALY